MLRSNVALSVVLMVEFTCPRGATAAPPPTLVTAYSISGNQVRVVFDQDVTTGSATNTSNYALSSFSSINAAVMDGTQAAVVSITNDLSAGELERITVNGIVSASSGIPMVDPQSHEFVSGVLSVADVRAPDPDYLGAPTCSDRSRFAGLGSALGPTLTVDALCSASLAGVSYLADTTNTNVRTGLAVVGTGAPERSEHGLVVGNVAEEAGGTVLHMGPAALAAKPCIGQCDRKFGCILLGCRNQICFYLCLIIGVGADNALAHGLRNTECDAEETVLTGRDYESAMVGFGQLRVLDSTPPGGGFRALPIDNTTDTVTVTNEGGAYTYAAQAGAIVGVEGVALWRNGRYVVAPRDDDDIVIGGTTDAPRTTSDQLNFSAYPNPSRSMTLTFTLPVPMKVDLSVFDASGRRVRTLIHSDLPAGPHAQVWTAREAETEPVAPGLYSIRLQAGERTVVLKRVVLR
jgi:hypothetical protein